MQRWNQSFHKYTGLSPYVWVVFFILPFYFILRSSSTVEKAVGIALIIGFFLCYGLSFVNKKGWLVYFWTGAQILISIIMTVTFGYVYFSLFLAFFIGNIQHRVGFFVLYGILLASTLVTINVGFATQGSTLLQQLPFVLLSLIAVILLPVSTYNKNRQDKLQGQLEDANKRISELVKLEERQRIARDLHDTLGQKLSLIGLKSDLAAKILRSNPDQAVQEMHDVRQTARTALNEVREMVTQMRGAKLEDEMYRVKQILKAAGIEFKLEGDPKLYDTALMTENVVAMCLKEAVTNVVKHSQATECTVRLEPRHTELVVQVRDNGVGLKEPLRGVRGNGLRGMKERLEFVNGSLDVRSGDGTTVVMKVPNVPKQPMKEADPG
ncbi:sensor histidine kinase [Paenibacillus sp. TRM 82003]|nr:sensor histidine kinase [Paenibacillus sp. TRM 82003]